jgi:hypothetical protein
VIRLRRDQVLDHVREAAKPVRVVGRAGVIGHFDRSEMRVRIGREDDRQPVGQDELLGREGEGIDGLRACRSRKKGARARDTHGKEKWPAFRCTHRDQESRRLSILLRRRVDR